MKAPFPLGTMGKIQKFPWGVSCTLLYLGDTMASVLRQNWDRLFLTAMARLGLMQTFGLTATMPHDKSGHTTAANELRVKSNGQTWLWQVTGISVISHDLGSTEVTSTYVNYKIKGSLWIIRKMFDFIMHGGWKIFRRADVQSLTGFNKFP